MLDFGATATNSRHLSIRGGFTPPPQARALLRRPNDSVAALRLSLGVLLALAVSAVLGAGVATAGTLSAQNFGVNVTTFSQKGQLGPSDLSAASASGLGIARVQLIQGGNADPVVALAASAHLRLDPMLGLPTQMTPSAAATAMAEYVTAFAQRYGPGGTFWSQNPQLPYLPVLSYEIGNEPNIPLQWIADDTNLHWTDPSAYAQVYEAARAALHQVDPTGVAAVVGGLADSASLGVDIPHDEEWLAALTPGTVDAVGYHPYTFDVSPSLMQSDTEVLREWMNSNGMQGVPIDVNEVGACDVLPQDTLNTGCATSMSSGAWGAFASSFTEWALCSPALNVESVQPEYWGDLSSTDTNAILALVSSEATLTPYGQDYLNEAQSLTSQGCPLANTSTPSIAGNPVSGQVLAANAGGWTGTPTFAYQWERCDANGLNCGDIPNASSAGYQAQPADVGSTVVAAVTASNADGSETAWSSPTDVVSPAPSSGGSGSGGSGSGGGSGSSGGSGGGGGVTPGGGSPPIVVLSSMRLQVSGVHVRGRSLSLTVNVAPGSGSLTVVAVKGHKQARLHVTHRTRGNTVLTFTAKLAAGRWTVTVSCQPPQGYAAPKPVRRRITIR